jgi:predicted nucleic acid-binding protein
MKKFVLDTGIILHYVRQSDLSQKIESELNLLSQNVVPVVASVSIGEIEGFVQRGKWGEKKIKRLKNLISKIVVIDITAEDEQLMKSYATLWNYSKNNLPGDKLGKSIGIGQNDVWIAALAKTANADLVTIDGDFEHLNNKWLTVHKF